MAASGQAQGYECEFREPVSDHYYCNKCGLVARKLILTSCCGESYCLACITDTQQQAKPCPACGQDNFTTIAPLKYRRRMAGLQVYCSIKGRGCGWTGTLEQLDTHLDSDLDNCLYVDTSCPLNCGKTVPKNMVEQHVTEECGQRDYGCQHCAFNATYEVVVDTHLPECVYMPLPCLNLCGVTCERGLMEDHMSMCRLEEVACEFTGVGCEGMFRREEQEEHTTHNTQKHLTITAAAAIKMKEQLQQQEEKIEYLEKKIQHQNKNQEKTLLELEKKFDRLLREQSHRNEAALKEVTHFINLKRTFAMENFSQKKADGSYWRSPAMYTHVCGYKFYMGINACGGNVGIVVHLYTTLGEYDDQLTWPACATITLKLINQEEGEDVKDIITFTWEKPKRSDTYIGYFKRIEPWFFMKHSELESFLIDDTLHFNIVSIKLCL